MIITAKNYISQLEKAIVSNRVVYLDGKIKSSYLNMIRTGEHFALPDGGAILNNGHKGLLNNELNLPYNCTTVEFFAPCFLNNEDKNFKDNEVNKMVIFEVFIFVI